jgi:hypothetical protein
VISSDKEKVAIIFLWGTYCVAGLILFWTYNVLPPKSGSDLNFAGSVLVSQQEQLLL